MGYGVLMGNKRFSGMLLLSFARLLSTLLHSFVGFIHSEQKGGKLPDSY